MIEKIKRFFLENLQSPAPESQAKALHLACAALMFEVSRVDQSIDEREIGVIQHVLQSQLKVADDELDEVMQLALEDSKDSTSVYQFTSLVNEHFNETQKFEIVIALWKVAYADQRIDKYEEHLIRKIAELIYVPHLKFIEAKHIAANLT